MDLKFAFGRAPCTVGSASLPCLRRINGFGIVSTISTFDLWEKLAFGDLQLTHTFDRPYGGS